VRYPINFLSFLWHQGLHFQSENHPEIMALKLQEHEKNALADLYAKEVAARQWPRIWLFIIPIIITYVVWTIYMQLTNSWHLFHRNWFMSVTMVFGSFIAGASSEGGGAVAFPAMTLIFHISPSVARTFSLAIQSIGMTAAALWIYVRRIPIETTYLWLAAVGGVGGMVVGTYFIAPIVPPAYAKMLFVSFWLSFGIALYAINHIKKRDTRNTLPDLSNYQKSEIIVLGIIGGILSAILGSGIDICTFSFVTMKYHLSEKVATPTSVVLMASNAILGLFLHAFFIHDFQGEAFNYWMVCIPVCALGAPLGAYVISKLTRLSIAVMLYLILLTQFIGAILIIRPGGMLLLFSVGVFLFGLLLFFVLTQISHRKLVSENL